MLEDKINELNNLIKEANNIVFLGGAGVSTESGIPDFRGENGIYKRKEYENVFDIDVFYQNPSIYYHFYFEMMDDKYLPNSAHLKLYELEKKKKVKYVITQNIDGLHQVAGSKKTIELHGTLNSYYCVDCQTKYDKKYIDKYKDKKEIPRCEKCKGLIRPDVVFFKEALKTTNLIKAHEAITKADLIIVGGTSLTVYPAAGLIEYYNKDYQKLVIINLSETPYDWLADLVINEKIGEIFKRIKI